MMNLIEWPPPSGLIHVETLFEEILCAIEDDGSTVKEVIAVTMLAVKTKAKNDTWTTEKPNGLIQDLLVSSWHVVDTADLIFYVGWPMVWPAFERMVNDS